MAVFLNILVCDDNTRFAESLAEGLQRKLKTRYGFSPAAFHIATAANTGGIRPLAVSSDVIFCDLGWGDLTLEGIQILHDIRLDMPRLATVLYTAQDEDEVIRQALQWKLGFIDQIIRIEGADYLDDMLAACWDVFCRKRGTMLAGLPSPAWKPYLETFADFRAGGDSAQLKTALATPVGSATLGDVFPECSHLALNAAHLTPAQAEAAAETVDNLLRQLESPAETTVSVRGLRLLPRDRRSDFSLGLAAELAPLAERLRGALTLDGQTLGADISLGADGIVLTLKSNPVDQKRQKYSELLQNLSRYPRLEPHELLPLDKARFIEFIKTRYGGFPQMAEARGLDLNNIYRVNRRFKAVPFVVFKCETAHEIAGLYDRSALEKQIHALLASPALIRQAAQRADS